MLDSHLIAKTAGRAKDSQIFTVGDLRVTVLTPMAIRVEKGIFTDSATQAVWYRDLPATPYTYFMKKNRLKITTEGGEFHLNARSGNLIFCVREGKTYPYRKKDNLFGTARTLDMTFGAIKLKEGLISRSGVSQFTDDTLLLKKDGTVGARNKSLDRYYFNSSSPRAVIRDYYALTGKPPLVPRYALGNWWSRYWAYTQQEYIDLLKRFREEDVPFWVATVDMDWHWVGVKKEFGYKWTEDKPYSLVPRPPITGWTGYTFNTELFPDYRKFLSDVKEMGYHISMNLHPADGVRRFESQYEAMCEAVGQDAKKKKAVRFDITSDKFLNAYFKILHKPYEKDGVDFWWIDWQQGKKSKLKGYDPLWACNHYHTLDNAANGNRPLILSRYAGLGSHRYPLGFSGDTAVNWRVLDFQPYFTYTASNAGYPNWSHDIGGHHFGDQGNDELYLRWLQFGVFSPILRLHSNNKAISKEPWNHKTVEETAKKYLRFRHRLLPYLYSETAKTWETGVALCEPMYYRHAEEEAYTAKNQYYFGSELLVAPVTVTATDGKSKRSVWFPQGEWTDIFGEEVMEGGEREITVPLERIPVYLKEGGILVLQDDIYDQGNPEKLTVWTALGTGAYTLYEDDNVSTDYQKGIAYRTALRTKTEGNRFAFVKEQGAGASELVPAARQWTVRLPFDGTVSTFINGEEVPHMQNGREIIVSGVAGSDVLEIRVEKKNL